MQDYITTEPSDRDIRCTRLFSVAIGADEMELTERFVHDLLNNHNIPVNDGLEGAYYCDELNETILVTCIGSTMVAS